MSVNSVSKRSSSVVQEDLIVLFDSDPTSATTTNSSSASSAATVAAAVATVAVPSAAAEDPEILALSQSLKALDVGTVSACLNFAKALSDQGILPMERLKRPSGKGPPNRENDRIPNRRDY
jgi:hypothetical protein